MEIINISPAYPSLSFYEVLPSLLEHEGHTLAVERNSGGGNAVSPELWLQCSEAQCRDNSVIMVLRLPVVAESFTLTVNARAWFNAEMPDAQELAEGIEQGLHQDFHSADSGGAWWIDNIVYGE